MNPYLNIYTTRHHKVSPWDSWNYAYLIIIIMFLIQFPTLFGHSSNCHVKTSRSHKLMINLIPSMPISFIRIPKHPSITTYIILGGKSLTHNYDKSPKQLRKHITHSQTRSGETLVLLTQRILAQARWATWGFHDFSLKRDEQRGVSTISRSSEMSSVGFFTISRSGETSSPERDMASLRTRAGRLSEFSWQ